MRRTEPFPTPCEFEQVPVPLVSGSGPGAERADPAKTGSLQRPGRYVTPVPTLVAALLLLVMLPAGAARGQNHAALINETLDKPVNLELNAILPEAMKVIEDRTSVPIRADPAVWELLPWGEQTSVNVKIQNQTLRQALGAITQKLGLTFGLVDEVVMLQPMPALRRLGKRATVQELETLDKLSAEPMPPVTGAGNVRAILTAIDLRLDAMKVPVAVEDGLDAETRGKIVGLPRNATMLDALEQVAKQTRATWYPWGRQVVVVPKDVQVRDQLARTITARYKDADIAQVLEDLRRRAGVPFEIEPGAVQRIPAEFRTVRVFWDNVSVQQALEALKGFAGIDYQVTDNGVKITNPSPAAAAAAATPADPVMAMVQLDNGMTLFLRESQVPPELRAYLQHRVKKSVDDLRAMAKAENFPLTQPATQAAQATTSTTTTTRPATQAVQ